jgi:hypothetical protein
MLSLFGWSRSKPILHQGQTSGLACHVTACSISIRMVDGRHDLILYLVISNSTPHESVAANTGAGYDSRRTCFYVCFIDALNLANVPTELTGKVFL